MPNRVVGNQWESLSLPHKIKMIDADTDVNAIGHCGGGYIAYIASNKISNHLLSATRSVVAFTGPLQRLPAGKQYRFLHF